MDRVDDQAHAAVGAVGAELGSRGIGPQPDEPGDDHRAAAAARRAAAGAASGCRTAPTASAATPSGKVIGETVFSEDDETASPQIPAEPQPGEYITVSGGDGDSRRYRVYAEPTPFAAAA